MKKTAAPNVRPVGKLGRGYLKINSKIHQKSTKINAIFWKKTNNQQRPRTKHNKKQQKTKRQQNTTNQQQNTTKKQQKSTTHNKTQQTNSKSQQKTTKNKKTTKETDISIRRLRGDGHGFGGSLGFLEILSALCALLRWYVAWTQVTAWYTFRPLTPSSIVF